LDYHCFSYLLKNGDFFRLHLTDFFLLLLDGFALAMGFKRQQQQQSQQQQY
jgi:hypothetical protein